MVFRRFCSTVEIFVLVLHNILHLLILARYIIYDSFVEDGIMGMLLHSVISVLASESLGSFFSLQFL